MLEFRIAPPLRRAGFLAAFLTMLCGVAAAGDPPENRVPPSPPASPPAASPEGEAESDAVLAEAHYVARVEKGVARITARLVVDVLTDKPAQLQIDFGETAVGTLTDKQQSAYLRGLGEGRFALCLTGKGRRELQLDLLAKTQTAAGGQSFAFSCPPAAVTSLDVSVPRENREIVVSPTLIAESPEDGAKAADGETRIQGRLTSAANIAVLWRDKPEAAKPEAPLATVSAATRLSLRPGGCSQTSVMTYTVHRGRLSKLNMTVPPGCRVLDVVGPDGAIRSWSTAGGEDGRTLAVELSKPVVDRIAVQVYAERKFADETVALSGVGEEGNAHGIHALGVARETGVIALSQDASLQVNLPESADWFAVNSSEAPPAIRVRGAQYLRYFSPQNVLAAEIEPVGTQIAVVQNVQYTVHRDKVEARSTMSYRVEGPAVESVRIGMPLGLMVKNVASPLVKSHELLDSSEPHVLVVHLKKPLQGNVELTVDVVRELTVGDRPAEIELPLLQPQDVVRHSGRITLKEGSLVELIPGDPPDGLAATDAPGDAVAWTFHELPEKLTVQAALLAADVAAATARTTVQLRDAGATLSTQIDFGPLAAPPAVYRLSIPAAARESLRIIEAGGTDLPVQFVPPADGRAPEENPAADGDGRLVVEVKPRNRSRIAPRLVVTYELPDSTLPRSSADRPVEFAVAPPRVLSSTGEPRPISRFTGEIAIPHSAGLLISPGPDSRFRKLPPEATGEIRFGYDDQSAEFPLKVATLEAKPFAETVVSRAFVEVALNGDAAAHYRCRYRLQTAEQHRLRVDLPKTVEPLGAFVDGRRVALQHDASARTETDWQAFLIDVSGEKDESPTSLLLQFRMPLTPAPFESPLGRVRLHLPQIGGVDGVEAVTQELRTAVWVPQQFALAETPHRFSRRTQTKLTGIGPSQFTATTETGELDDWIGVGVPADLAFPRTGHVYRFDGDGGAKVLEVTHADLGVATWIVGVPLLFIGILLARTSWQNRVGFVMFLGFVALLTAAKNPDVVYHGLLAARYGLAGMLLWWVGRGVVVRLGEGVRPPDEAVQPCPLPLRGLPAVIVPPPGSLGGPPSKAA